jgi:hypothetical protein
MGGTPSIQFTHCRGNDKKEIWECVYNFQINNLTVLTKKIVSIKNADGKFPYRLSGEITAKLPINAVITRITLSVPAGVTNDTDLNNFSLKTAEGTVLLAQTTGNLNQGFINDINNILIICDTDAKRTISFSSGSNINQALGKGSMCFAAGVMKNVPITVA